MLTCHDMYCTLYCKGKRIKSCSQVFKMIYMLVNHPQNISVRLEKVLRPYFHVHFFFFSKNCTLNLGCILDADKYGIWEKAVGRMDSESNEIVYNKFGVFSRGEGIGWVRGLDSLAFFHYPQTCLCSSESLYIIIQSKCICGMVHILNLTNVFTIVWMSYHFDFWPCKLKINPNFFQLISLVSHTPNFCITGSPYIYLTHEFSSKLCKNFLLNIEELNEIHLNIENEAFIIQLITELGRAFLAATDASTQTCASYALQVSTFWNKEKIAVQRVLLCTHMPDTLHEIELRLFLQIVNGYALSLITMPPPSCEIIIFYGHLPSGFWISCPFPIN